MLFLAAILAAGWLGARIGREPMVIAFGIAFVALTIPLYTVLDGSFATLLTTLLISLTAVALLFGVNGAIWAEVFPTPVRATGVEGPLSLATAVRWHRTLHQHGTRPGRPANRFLCYLMAVSAITSSPACS